MTTTTFQRQWEQQFANYLVMRVRAAQRDPATLVFIERICDAGGVMIISEATNRLAKRLEAGLHLTDAELERLSYALSAGKPI
jgi:hypothetical protein